MQPEIHKDGGSIFNNNVNNQNVPIFIWSDCVAFQNLESRFLSKNGKQNLGAEQRRIAKGGHGLPKVSPRPAMHDTSTPYGWPTPETALSGVACPQGGRPAAIFYPFGHPTPYAYGAERLTGDIAVSEMSWGRFHTSGNL
jgi:hypothetical protein